MANFVLVHCAQGGGWAWKFVSPLLREAGHVVYAPSLTGLGDRKHLANPNVNLDTHITDIVNLIEFEDLTDVILVGWSYGGMVVTGVADRIPDKLAHVVYLDAEVPEHGQSLFDINGETFRKQMEDSALATGDGWLASFGTPEVLNEDEKLWMPDDELRQWYVAKMAASPQPIETYRQRISLSNTTIKKLPRTFFRFPVDGEVFGSLFDSIADSFRKNPFWRYEEVNTNHCGPLVAPGLVSNALLTVLEPM